MLDEVLEWLRVKPGGIYADATLGAGGHSAAIAEKLTSGTTPEHPSGRLISVDRDAQALEVARERLKIFGATVTLVQGPCASWGFPGWTGSWPTWEFRACSLIKPRGDFHFARRVRWTCAWMPRVTK